LTHVGNRRKLEYNLKERWEEARIFNETLSVLMFDIDYFKEFNDTYGHTVGDTCLKMVATTVGKLVIKANAELFRYGGEEFVILYPKATTSDARKLGEEVLNSIEKLSIPHATSKVSYTVTVSVGIASMNHAEHPEEIINLTDKALYHAKESGKNQLKVYNEFSIKVI